MSDLSAFRHSAAAMRSRGAAFGGTFVKFNGESGDWSFKKDRETTVINGRRLVADVSDLLLGWQKFEDDKPIYAGTGRVRDGHLPPARATLDAQDKKRWRNNLDPWSLTHYLALGDLETSEQFVFTTSSAGGRDCLAILQDAFCDHNEERDGTEYEWPVVELASTNYVNSFGKKIFVPCLDILGWAPPPNGFKAIKPPADATKAIELNKMLALPMKKELAHDDMDDSIPF